MYVSKVIFQYGSAPGLIFFLVVYTPKFTVYRSTDDSNDDNNNNQNACMQFSVVMIFINAWLGSW